MKLRSYSKAQSKSKAKSYSVNSLVKSYTLSSSYSSRITIKTKSDKKFVKWMNKVEKGVYDQIKVALTDLPDEDYRMLFEDNLSSNEMVTIVTKDYNLLVDFFQTQSK